MSYQSKHTGAAIDASVDTTQQILNMIYPVGSIYMSVNNVSPATFIGGTWTALTDRVLIGAGSSYAVNATGGATSHTHTSAAHTHTSAAHTHTTAGHTLTVDEIPSHNHAELATFHQGNDTQSVFLMLVQGILIQVEQLYRMLLPLQIITALVIEAVVPAIVMETQAQQHQELQVLPLLATQALALTYHHILLYICGKEQHNCDKNF